METGKLDPQATRHAPASTSRRKQQVAGGDIQPGAVDANVVRALRRDRQMVLAASAGLVLVFIVGIANLAAAWLAGRSLDWRLANETTLALVPLVGLVLVLCVALAHWNWAFVRSLTLRSAALAGYDQVAPLADRQPARLKSRELAQIPVELGALPRVEEAARPTLVLAVSVVGALVVLLGAWALLRGVALVGVYAQLASLLAGFAATDPLRRFALGVLLVLDLLALVFALLLMVRHLAHLRAGHGPYLVVDENGLRLASGPQAIAWGQARGFYMAVERGWPGRPTRSIYVLDTGGLQVSWAITAGAAAEVVRQHDWLARVIVTRTRLPLRDLSREANRLAGWRGLWSAPTTLAADAIVRSWIHLGVAGAADVRLKRATRQLYLVAAVALAALALLAGTSAFAQRAQARQYTTLLARIQAAKPLYADPLSAQDNDWPTRHPSADTGTFEFAGESYQLGHGPSGAFLYALGPKTFGNAAVQVTVRQDGSSASGAVGLALRAQDDPASFVVFAVNQRGGWFLARYTGASESAAPGVWSLLSGDVTSAAAHRGPGQPNDLMVLTVGTTYTCFINGRFVGTVRAPASGAFTTGAAGVWLGDATTTGAFTHFAVYPAPTA